MSVSTSMRKAGRSIVEGIRATRVPRASDSTLIPEWIRPFLDSDDMVVITDMTGKVVHANRAAELKTGFALKEMIGRKPGDMWGGNMPRKVYADMWNTISKGRMYNFTVRNQKKDGTPFYVDLKIHPVKNDTGEIVAFMATEADVTERRRSEDALSAIIHRAKSPVSAEKILLDLLKSNMSNFTAEQRDLIEDLSNTNEYTLELLKNLLVASRMRSSSSLEVGVTEPLKKIVAEVLEKYKNCIGEKELCIVRDFEAEHSVPRVAEEIVDNLISNAVKYSKMGGIIKLSLAKKHGRVIFTCANEGVGIPKEEQGAIFTPLYRASNADKNKSESSGLGLYISKRLADDLGYTLSFRSGKRKTTFILKMPAL